MGREITIYFGARTRMSGVSAHGKVFKMWWVSWVKNTHPWWWTAGIWCNDAFPGLQIISFCESSNTGSIFNAHLVCSSHRWSPMGTWQLTTHFNWWCRFHFPGSPPNANQRQAPFHPISSMKSLPNTPHQWLPQNLATAFSKSRTQISWQIKQSGPLLVIEVGL